MNPYLIWKHIRVLSMLIIYVNMKKYHSISFLFISQKYWAKNTRMRKVPIVRKVPNYWKTTTKRKKSLKKVCIKINISKWLTSWIMHYKRKHMQFWFMLRKKFAYWTKWGKKKERSTKNCHAFARSKKLFVISDPRRTLLAKHQINDFKKYCSNCS